MTPITFPDTHHYDFAATLMSSVQAAYGGNVDPNMLTITVAHPVVSRLLARVAAGLPAVLPYFDRQGDAWIIAGSTDRDLDRLLLRITRFVVPTYAEFAHGQHTPLRRPFDSSGNALQRHGAALYPAGYYSWRSPVAYRDLILARLDRWLTLEQQRPPLHMNRPPAYRDTHDRFTEALAAGDWPVAEACLHDMQRYALSTADNLAFLQIQLLAQQQRWGAIWARTDFPTLAALRVPRAVRAALITAFHHTILLPLEQQGDWPTARVAFADGRPRLVNLLTGRFDATASPVVHVFAYEAAFMGNRAELDALRALNATAPALPTLLDYLQTTLPLLEPGPIIFISPLQQVAQALVDRDYDRAWRAATTVEPDLDRVPLLLSIAFQSGDPGVAEHALLSFWTMDVMAQQQIQDKDPHVAYYLPYLEKITAATTPPAIANWVEWFVRVQNNPEDPAIQGAIPALESITDERYWTDDTVRAVGAGLTDIVLDPALLARTYVRRLVQYFVTVFLSDNLFPRVDDAYADLYEALYVALLERSDINEPASLILLRLADAKLRRKPADAESVLRHCIDWFKIPIPALQSCVLEAFDLLASYGVPGPLLADWYRRWALTMLGVPGSPDRTTVQAWLSFGEWIQPGADVLLSLRQALEVTSDDDDPLAPLPAGYLIGIFTLRPQSAERARSALLARNPSLDVRICVATDLDDRAKALARNAQMAVVVTTCITHSLTYGIGPYLQHEPIYPTSSGATSIVRAVESYSRKIM